MSVSVLAGRGAGVAAALLLAGCAALPADRGTAEVQALLTARDPAWAARAGLAPLGEVEAQAQVAQLLDAPLSPTRALGVALLRNPAVRLHYARLGLVEADWLEASRLSNPVLSLSLLETDAAGGGRRFGYSLTQEFGRLLFMRSRHRAADAGAMQARVEVAHALQQLALEVDSHYYAWVGAAQLAQMRALQMRAAEASAELARRFHAAGNLSALQLAREQAAAHEAGLHGEAAAAQEVQARMALNTVMGLTPLASWAADPRLPLPVDADCDLPTALALATEHRLDLRAADLEREALEETVQLSRRLRWLPFIEVGVEGEREPDGSRMLGPSLSLALPVFGSARSPALRARAQLERSQAEGDARRLSVAHEVAAAHARMVAARQRFERHRQGLVPEREAVVARLQEFQNYMLAGQFELLLAKQQEYAAYEGYLGALRDYWLARVQLAAAVGGALPDTPSSDHPQAAVPQLPDAATDAHAHHSAPVPAPAPAPAPANPHAGHAMPATDDAHSHHHHHGDH